MTTAASGAQIAALLSRASRHRALLRHVRATGLITRAGGSSSDRLRELAWRKTSATSLQCVGFATSASGGKKKLPSLTISEAFDREDDEEEMSTDGDDELSFGFDLEDLEDDKNMKQVDDLDILHGADEPLETPDDDARTSALSVDDLRELAKRLRFAMDRKKQWMQRLAEAREFDTLLKVVYECYAPLYASHPLLQHTPCRLFDAYEDPVAAADATTKYHPKWYDDQVTKITEQEAMALLVNMQRPELAMAVFRHREWLATKLGSVTISRGDNVLTDNVTVDFTKHFRSYFSWAMGACAALGDHAQVFTIYENALEDGVFPTANMTLSYLNSLIAKREFDAVEALFTQMQKDDRPTNLYFYRQMLFFTRATNNSKIMEVVLNEMKIKGFKVRSDDYLNAIRSLDVLYYRRAVQTTEQRTERSEYMLDETYGECVARVADQEASPEKYALQEKACGKVIKLFDEMVDVEQLPPQHELFFPRVIAAALFLHDYDRVVGYVTQYEQCFNKPLTDATALKMAVNALLVKDEPAAAWTLVLQAHAQQKPKPRGRGKRDDSVLASIGSVVEYLASHHETANVLALLEVLDAKRLLGQALTPRLATMLLNTLVRDTAAVPNEQLWELVQKKYWVAFPVNSRVKMLTQFVDMCVAADRWWVVSQVLHKRNRAEIPTIPARIALYLSTKGLESTTDLERIELVAHLAMMADIPAMTADARLAFCCNVLRALHALRNDGSRGLHRQREISRLHDQYLRAKGLNIPLDVREILMHQT